MRDHRIVGLGQGRMVVLLRWVLIIATSYLLLFSRDDLAATPPSVALFIAVYLGSNLVLSAYWAQLRGRWLDIGIVLFDIAAVGVGLSLTKTGSVDFFPVFFLVVLIGALTERIGLVVGAAVLIGIVHLSTLSHFVDSRELLDSGHILRIPFLFVVALFFGFEAKLVRSRERSDQKRERKRLATESLTAITHDLKNPLSVIQSLAGLLLEGNAGQLNPDQVGLVRRIHANVRRVLQLSGNLLDVARIQEGRVDLQLLPANLNDVVEDALALVRSAAEVKGVALHFTPTVTPVLASIDSLQVGRVMSNLLDNAIKYTPAGGTVEVSVQPAHGEIAIDVKDSGPGIGPEHLTTLFGKYNRSIESSRIQGTGLGLFIVKAIVEAHGGHVAIASEVGKGTTVSVRLTADPVRGEPVTAASEPEEARWPLAVAGAG